ncbi:MAG TPA: tetratricopeptide repeat protein [Methylomirabilota bacterium]|nr:tetratricopeptide repeat protein [Methylomirabilota bacterium]
MRPTLGRLWWPGRRRRPRVPAALFAHADRLRRQGRYAEAGRLVAAGLTGDPDNLTGHLLAAYLHLAARTIEPARAEFRWVLARQAGHPRALLGLARLALEDGDLDACRAALAQALQHHPEFPEAEALLGAIGNRHPLSAVSASPRLERLRLPPLARALLVLAADGSLLTARPSESKGDGDHLARALSLAGATLRRAGWGAPRRALIEDGEETYFVRGDATLTLALALPRTTQIAQGVLEVNRLWAAAQHALAVRVEAPAPASPPAERPRRVS